MLQKLGSNSTLKLITPIIIGTLVMGLFWRYGGRILAILMPFTVSIAIAYILNPLVEWLQKYRINRVFAVTIIFVVFFGLLTMLFFEMIPSISSEITHFSNNIPKYIQQAEELVVEFDETLTLLELPDSFYVAINDALTAIEATLLDILTRVPQITFGIAQLVFNIFVILILTFYFLKDYNFFKQAFFNAIPAKRKTQAHAILREIDHSLVNYIRGQFIICTVIGISTYLALLVLKVDFALMLGVFAGITNIIPYIGPFIGAVPAVVVALFHSPMLALTVAVAIIIIQQVESQLIAPQVLGKRMGMHPVMIIAALTVGGQFFGIVGMIIAVPVFAIIRILARHLKIFLQVENNTLDSHDNTVRK